jgi:hypothetical protein
MLQLLAVSVDEIGTLPNPGRSSLAKILTSDPPGICSVPFSCSHRQQKYWTP